jgi:hypothetical protein
MVKWKYQDTFRKGFFTFFCQKSSQFARKTCEDIENWGFAADFDTGMVLKYGLLLTQ